MESAKAEVKYSIFTTVAKVEEKFTKEYVCGVGKEAVFRDRSIGWFIEFEGSRESLYIGTEKPAMQLYDQVMITFERVHNNGIHLCPPSTSTSPTISPSS